MSISSQDATITGISISIGPEVDAVLAELFDMGFPLAATATAINQLGSLNREDLLEFMLRSEGSPAKATNEQEGTGSDTPDIACDAKQKGLLPHDQDVDECFTYPKQLLASQVEPGKPSTSTSVVPSFRPTWRNQISRINDPLDKVLSEPQSFNTFMKSPLLQRLIEMGCRADVAEKAYELYGMDPAYGSENEKLDVMCDYIAAVNLNEEEDEDLEAEDQEIRDSGSYQHEAGIEEWFASQSDIGDSQTAAQVHTRRPLHSQCPGVKQEQNVEEHTPGGYYKYIGEDDPDQEELFYKDMEEQEGMALFVVKRRRLLGEPAVPPSARMRGVRKRPQVTKCLVGPVIRRIRVPHYTNMTGYGIPGSPIIPRELPQRSLESPPYFYFENVAFMPGDEWDTISRHLYDIEPEFVNAYHFTVCKRPRGYVHNLPVKGRFEVVPRAPRTIKELVPYSSTYWPSWDDRTTFSCICTSAATEGAIKPVTKLLGYMGSMKEPPAQIRRQIMDLLRMYNMVWIGPGQVARPKVEELEVCMGFDPDHTRSILSTNQQIKGLGNAFQVHTVGYHLSVLKKIFPKGLNVLSLFSGIGGAEVALYKLGIEMKVAVCVEIDPKMRRVIEHWWKVSNQSGRLITSYENVNDLDHDTLHKLMVEVGGFDLVVGGSPCSNLSAKNRFTRMGLGGKASIVFFEYSRILKDVRAFGLRHRHRRFHA